MKKLMEEVDSFGVPGEGDDVSVRLGNGLAKGMPDDAFDPVELKMGINVEFEHTKDVEIAKQIAKDHLSEIPDYYTRLKAMEKEAQPVEKT